MENKIWGIPCVIDNNNKIVYLKCDSAITAMGIGSMVEKYYPGYRGHIGSQEYIEKLKNQLAN